MTARNGLRHVMSNGGTMFRKLLPGALLILAASAAFAPSSAAASGFIASTTGALTGEAATTQTLTSKAGTVECTKLTATGEVEGTLDEETGTYTSEAQELKVQYASCKAFGFLSATVSEADLVFDIGGTVELLNTMTISTTGCEIIIPPQTLTGATYKDSGEGVEASLALGKVQSRGVGSLCAYEEEKEGTDKGSAKVLLAAGKLQIGPVPKKLFKVKFKIVGKPGQAEFLNAGEKGILIWNAEPGVAEKITEKAIIDPKAPYVATAFNLLKDECENKEIKAAKPGEPAKTCELEIGFTKPKEGAVKKGKENIVGIHPAKWAAKTYESVTEKGEW
jgi:hypothetical protein